MQNLITAKNQNNYLLKLYEAVPSRIWHSLGYSEDRYAEKHETEEDAYPATAFIANYYRLPIIIILSLLNDLIDQEGIAARDLSEPLDIDIDEVTSTSITINYLDGRVIKYSLNAPEHLV